MQNNSHDRPERTGSDFGKFNTASDLVEAYNALEREFTKRCQLVKQLQTELELLRAQAENEKDTIADAQETGADEPPVTADVTPNEGDGAATKVQPDNSTEQAEKGAVAAVIASTADVDDGGGTVAPSEPVEISERAVLEEIAKNAEYFADKLCAVPEIMDACIALYKQRLIETKNAVSPRGMAVIVPSKRPRTLWEAKALADALLSGD